jgi:hypothetical protein
MSTISSALSCSTIHLLASRYPFRTRNASNLITCLAFQLYFSGRAAYLSYQEPTPYIALQTIANLDAIYGYFLYDLAYLFLTTPTSPYIIHHFIGLYILHQIKQYGAPLYALKEYNMICFVAECTSPFLQLRHFAKGTSLYPYLMQFAFYLYGASRMIAMPIYSITLMQLLGSKVLWTPLLAVYAMSAYWFFKMRAMIQ